METIMDTFIIVRNEEGKEPIRENITPYSSYVSAHAARKALEKTFGTSKVTFEIRQLGGNLNARIK